MTIHILLCDSFPGLLPASIPSYESLFMDLFNREQTGIKYKVYKAYKKEFPDTLCPKDLYLIPGSMSGAYEEKEWIGDLLAFIRKAYQKKVPLAGVCFGHQAIAQALGGKVEPAQKGWGTGIRRSAIIHKVGLEWFPEGNISLHYNHHDQVKTLPPDAKRWATSGFCPNEGFIIGNHVVTFQGHPEYTDEYNHYFITQHGNLEPEQVKQDALASIQELTHQGTIAARWMLSLIS